MTIQQAFDALAYQCQWYLDVAFEQATNRIRYGTSDPHGGQGRQLFPIGHPFFTEQEAFQEGWDYPPFIGMWGVVSPRTCGDCPIDKTAWWAVAMGATAFDLSDHHMKTINRILAERQVA